MVTPVELGHPTPSSPTGTTEATDQSASTSVLDSASVTTRSDRGQPTAQTIDETVALARTSDRDTNETTVAAVERVATISDHVSESVTPTQRVQTTGDEELEIEQHDPMYRWHGGTPYSLTKPQLIVHLDPEEVSSLPFVQRVLRDTYRELNGGEPRITSVTTTGPTTDLPRVADGIVTLDLTDDGWSVSVDPTGASVTKEAESTEFTDVLKTAVESMYGGGLGYLVANVATSDARPLLVDDGPVQLVRTLLGVDDLPETPAEDGLFKLAGAPVRLVEPRTNSPDVFRARVGSYFGLDSPDYDRVADIEAQSDRILDRESWPRTVLTARQDTGEGESSTHYRWKATLVGGLARNLWSEYRALDPSADENLSFEQFVTEQLLQSIPLETETAIDDSDEAVQPDITVDVSEPWLREGVRQFADLDRMPSNRVVFEFETGFSEGQFNHRKLRKTVEKYNESMDQWIGVVVPPRILFRNRSRAELARRLVDTWPPDGTSAATAALCVPVFDGRSCQRLRRATGVIDEWFAAVAEEDN